MNLGSVTPGSPMTHFPMIASLFKLGLEVGPLVSYLTAWSLFARQRMILWEVPFLRPKVVAVRVAVSFVLAIFSRLALRTGLGKNSELAV